MRVPSLLCKRPCLVNPLKWFVHARNDRHATLHRSLAGLCFVAHALDGLWQGPHKSDALFCTAARKGGVLAQQAVSRVDDVGTWLHEFQQANKAEYI